MKCKQCNTEMMIVKTEVNKEEAKETFIYKCPNPNCENYGFKGK